MDWLRRWIVQLFNIKAKDLQKPTDSADESKTIKEEIQVEVNKQVREQLQESLREVLLPEIQKTISSQISQLVQQISASDLRAAAPADIDIGYKLGLQGQRPHPPEETILPDEAAGVELPIIDEVEESVGPSSAGIVVNEPAPLSITPVAPEGDRTEPETIAEEILPLAEVVTQPSAEVPSTLRHEVDEKEIRIGIDFGTTTTAISIKVGDDRPEALPIGQDGTTRYMPSVVYMQPGSGDIDERAIVGEEAERYGDQTSIIRSVKRCFGCQGGNCHGIGDNYPFAWCRGDGKIYINEYESTQPTKIAYLIIREALSRAIKVARERWQLDLTLENICFLPLNLGCGANFDLIRREMICSIAKDLGFQNIRIDNIVEEPILAGFAFSRFAEEPEGLALIYDFGGGTFDVAVLDVDRPDNNLRVTVVATAGENWLGGDDIDTLIYQHFLQEIAEEKESTVVGVQENLDALERGKLRQLARNAKETLSTNITYSNVLFTSKFGTINIDLSRQNFEELLDDSRMIKKSLDAVERACRLAYAYENAKNGTLIDYPAIFKHSIVDAAPKITKVILIGGVTKIPLIRKKLIEIFGSEKIVAETVVEPISAVAIGGAYPREQQHYSICVPPFGFYLEYQTSCSEKHSQFIFEPYEYYDFHKGWMFLAKAEHFKDIDIQETYFKVMICAKMAGRNEYEWSTSLGNLLPGIWRFSVSFEGDLYYCKVGEKPILIKRYPRIHPIQKAISDAREEREKQERIKKHPPVDYFEEIRRMAQDN